MVNEMVKCQKCGRDVIKCFTEDSKTVELEVGGAVFTFAERPVDGGYLAKPAKFDPSKRIGIRHMCAEAPSLAQKK